MKNFRELDNDDINEINYRIDSISDEFVSSEHDYVYLRRQLRHILEVVLTDEEFNMLYGVKHGI